MKERLKTLSVAIIGFFLMWACLSLFMAIGFRAPRTSGTPLVRYVLHETLPTAWSFFRPILPAGLILSSVAVIGWLLYELVRKETT